MWGPDYPPAPKTDFTAAFIPEELEQMAKPTAPVTLKVMTVEDIALVIRQFAEAGVRAKTAGFDAVEIHGGHGYLLSSFISPKTNKRTDDYGGSRENRIRFLLEVIRAVRAAVGPDFPVWCKLDSRRDALQLTAYVDDAREILARWREIGL